MVVAHVDAVTLVVVETVVTLTTVPLLVLPPHEEGHGSSAATTEPHESQTNSETGGVGRGLRLDEDVGSNDTGNVTNHDLGGSTERTLPVTRQVVLQPSQSHRGDHVGSSKDGEDSTELVVAGLALLGEQHGVSDRDHASADVHEAGAVLESVGGPGGDQHASSGEHVDGDGADLGLLGNPAELVQNRRQEEGSGQTRDGDTHVDEGAEPDLVVGVDELPGELVEGVHTALVTNIAKHAAAQDLLLLGVEPLGLLRPVDDEESRGNGEQRGRATLNDEDPAPGGEALGTAHLGDGIGEKTTERAGNDGAAEEEGHALLVLVALVVHGGDVDDTGQDTGLEDTEEESQTDELAVVLNETHAHVDDAPDEHEGGEVDRRAQLLDNHVRGDFQQDVRDIVDLRNVRFTFSNSIGVYGYTHEERNVEAVASELKIGNHALNSRVGDVDAIQERHHVDDEEYWVDDQVKLANKLGLGLGVDIEVLGGGRAISLGGAREGSLARLDGLLLNSGRIRRHCVGELKMGRTNVVQG